MATRPRSTKKTAAPKKNATTSKKKKASKAVPTAPKKPRAASSVPEDLVHYYRLVFQVEPGGSRKAEFFVAGTLDEIKRAALNDLEDGDGAYHALVYGETIVLQCWEGTKKKASIDLHPFITYRIDGIPEPVRFSGPGPKSVLDADAPGMGDLIFSMHRGKLDMSVTIDWASVKLPKLAGRALTKKEKAPFDHPKEPWSYGFHDDWDQTLEDP